MSTIAFEARIIKTTDQAALCSIDGEQVWIPKSQITDDSEIWEQGEEGKLVITEWISLQKGLI